jgi:hypothetical protein
MPRFMAIHTTPQSASQEQLTVLAKKLHASVVPGAKWISSWWEEGEAGKMLCEWEAENEEAIHASLESVKEYFPVETIYAVTRIDPEWFV